MLAAISIITLSSFNTNKIEKPNVELQTWYYSCGDGSGGTFLMPRGSTHDNALVIAQHLCA